MESNGAELHDAIFRDVHGETWAVEVDAYTIDQARKETGINLAHLVDSDGNTILQTLETDAPQFVSVLFCLCEDQIEKRGTTPKQFAKALASGEVMEAAYDAFMEAITNFFPPRRRAVLKQLRSKIDDVNSRLLTVAETKMSDGEMDRLIEKTVQDYNDSFTSTAGLSESKDQDV